MVSTSVALIFATMALIATINEALAVRSFLKRNDDTPPAATVVGGGNPSAAALPIAPPLTENKQQKRFDFDGFYGYYGGGNPAYGSSAEKRFDLDGYYFDQPASGPYFYGGVHKRFDPYWSGPSGGVYGFDGGYMEKRFAGPRAFLKK